MLDVLRSWINRFLSDEEAVLFALLLGASFFLLFTIGSTLAPLLTSMVIAFLLQGISAFLVRYRVPARVAVALTFLLFLGGFISLLIFVIPLVWRQTTLLLAELPAMLSQGRVLLQQFRDQYPYLLSQQQVDSLVDLTGTEIAYSGEQILSFSLSTLPLLASILLYVFLLPMLVFFFLKDKQLILDWVKSFLPEKRPLMDRIGAEMNVQMANYVRGKVIEIIIVGIVTFGLFWWFDMDYSALLGFLVGLSVIVPYVGVAIVSVPVLLIAFLQWGLTPEFFYVVGGYGILQILDGMVLVPLLFSEAVNLHPILIIVAVLVFGSLWGIWGVFFAIPLATLVKSIMNAWPQQREADSQAGH